MVLQQHFAVSAQGEAEEQQSGVAPVIMALFWGELKGFCLSPPGKFQQLEMRRTHCLGAPRRVKSAPELLNVCWGSRRRGLPILRQIQEGWEGQKWNS